MWTCTVCGREFKRKNQSHSCKSSSTMDEYIAQFSIGDQEKLQALRKMIKNAAPHSQEKMSWNMPTFYQNGNIAHFALKQNHIGFYVGATAVTAFAKELSNYQCNKGSIHLPKDQPLAGDLIEKIVRFNVARKSAE